MSRIDPATLVHAVVDEVADWDGVLTVPHRFGGTEFRLDGREFGHVHVGGVVDVAFARTLRDALVDANWTGPHHLYPDSGWTTLRLTGARDLDHARRVLRISFLYHVCRLRQRAARDGFVRRFDHVDVSAELDALDAPERVRQAFEVFENRTATATARDEEPVG